MTTEMIRFKNYLTHVIEIDNDSFDNATKYFEVEKISKGDYLVQERQICGKIAYISDGLFRIFNLKDGVEVNTCFCKENSITSSFRSFINQTPSKESIQAIENSTVITISWSNINKLQNESAIWQKLRQTLTDKECVRLSDRATSLSFESALEKYENILKYQPEIVQRVPIQHIASYIGVSRETLSRIRSKIG